MTRAALVAALTALGCGSTPSPATPAIEVPRRAATAGDELLTLIPAGADALLEIDLARLRANGTVGPLVRAMAAPNELGLGFDLVRDADLVIIASYGVGSASAANLTIVRGDGARDIAGAQPIGERTVALAPPSLASRIDAVRLGAQPSLAQSRALLAVRARAMPGQAQGAALRASAVLGFDARVALARDLDLDAVPRALSVWGDVADDLAIVARLDGDDVREGKRLAAAFERARDRVASSETLSRLVLGYVVRGAQVSSKGASARAVLVVGPRRLERIVQRLMDKLGESPKETT